MKTPVLITGVGKRLGLALAKEFLAQGRAVIGTYRTDRDSIQQLREAGAQLYRCDFYQQDSVDALINKLTSQHPQLRAIIHNASDWLPEKCDYAPHSLLQRMMQVHASVPYQINLACRDALFACEEGHADIIHISDYAVEKGSQKHIAYIASKAALESMTRSFAALYAPKVKVNTLAPALMLFNEHDSEEYKARTLTKALLPREGGEREFLNAVKFLLDSEFMTGRCLRLDGGRHLK